jgi:hypothetical protein
MRALDDHLGYHVRVISAHLEPRVYSNHGVPLLLGHHINERPSRHLGERLASSSRPWTSTTETEIGYRGLMGFGSFPIDCLAP